MNALNVRPCYRGGNLVALFDVAVSPDLTIHDLQLRYDTRGNYDCHSPSRRGRKACRLSPGLADVFRDLAIAAAEAEGVNID
ncbi:hypothetical protein C5L14_23205 [Labrys okinawensis]|uniref:Uncharacterized protein n=1 Tax=Labrys okinawensis TaxID=346911 RepID=A0A2S9Q7M4_9HYPH|nr:hypothetical protein [Labrys okinawensis]PRH85351.1 hypothetical protein C5L14_23205 [Labrys okinawensis]